MNVQGNRTSYVISIRYITCNILHVYGPWGLSKLDKFIHSNLFSLVLLHFFDFHSFSFDVIRCLDFITGIVISGAWRGGVINLAV